MDVLADACLLDHEAVLTRPSKLLCGLGRLGVFALYVRIAVVDEQEDAPGVVSSSSREEPPRW